MRRSGAAGRRRAVSVVRRQFTVTPHRPWRHGLLALCALLALSASGWLLFQRGRVQAGYDRDVWQETELGLRQHIEELELRNAELLKHSAIVQRSADIDRNAYAEIQRTLANTQTEMLALREELSFYRGLVTPSDKAAGLHVDRLELQSVDANQYQYLLTLIQVRNNDKFASGEVDLRVVGMQGDEQKTYSFAELSNGEARKSPFKFKYFQNFEGTLVLPDGFQPQSVEVEVAPRGRNLSAVSKRFDWSSLTTGGS